MRKDHKINTLEAFALSLAAMAPTGSMAGNTGPGAKFAGVNLPLAFFVAAIAMLLVAAGFYEMSKRVAEDGSIYAYNRISLGEHWGFISSWIMILGYLTFSIAMAALTGNYATIILHNLGVGISPVMLGFGVLLITWLTLDHGIRITSNFSLGSESLALLILFILCLIILKRGGGNGVNLKPLIPTTSLSGIGHGVVYTVLCFVGFEVACTVATRTEKPKRSVPIALLATLLGGAVIFIFVSYCVVIGFGTNHVSALANSAAPLNTLAMRFMNSGMATLIDFAIFLSAFGATIGMTNAAAYVLYALGEKGYLSKSLGKFDYRHNAPRHAVDLINVISIVLYLIGALSGGVNATYLDYITLGAICMLVIYVLSCVGTLVFFKNDHQHYSFLKHQLAPILGILVLILPLASNLYPIPAFPISTFPYLILVWGVIGYGISWWHTRKIK